MRLPDIMPARLRSTEVPFSGILIAGNRIMPQGWFEDIIPGGAALRCSACCAGKAGFGACVARCLATNQACDGGVENCTPC